MNRFILFLLLATTINSSYGQSLHIPSHSCMFGLAELYGDVNINVSDADSDVQKIWDELLTVSGNKGINANLKKSTERNFESFYQNGAGWIIYNPNILSQWPNDGNYKWMVAFILAHELGHITLLHNLSSGSNKSWELRADEWACQQLCKMRATKEEATFAIWAIVPGKSPAGYPTKKERLDAVANFFRINNCSRVDLDSGHIKALEDDLYVQQQLKIADEYYNNDKYTLAFPVYEKYRNHYLFNSDEQCSLGWMYWAYHGDGRKNGIIKYSTRNGEKWFRKSAEQGNVGGEFFLGLIYDPFSSGLDDSIRHNTDSSGKWYMKAAQKGNAEAQARLGFIYEAGKNNFSKNKNITEAIKWYQKSSDQGNCWGQFHLANLFEKGEIGVSKDIKKAKELFQKAAKNGYGCAQTASQSGCKRLGIAWQNL